MATLIKVDGTEQMVAPANGRDFQLEEFYRLIGGGCDIVQVLILPGGRLLVMDEEGKLRRPMPPVNETATALARRAGISPFDVVVGDVLVCAGREIR